ncbi:uroporphyrinogen-III synthase [Celeribacter baekdonensis]|uniref:uroporphyrinogen-III synthase n=1 Tax=Celeribacter baekdonensis TaxID=875171 RepID=UPI00131F2262|nr:uroporphyrinogen-III synthase [Celeribacter baekdonensis]
MNRQTIPRPILPQTVLITRPQDDATRLAQDLRALVPGAAVLTAPVLEIVPCVPSVTTQRYDAVILTSRHAAQAAMEMFPKLTAYCVGDATAQAAQSIGLMAVSVAGSADDLIAYLAEKPLCRAIHLHGKHTRGDVAGRLTAGGLETDDAVVYDQQARTWTSEEQNSVAQAQSLVVPLYSPRSAQILSKRLEIYCGRLTLVAMSQACLDAWSGPAPICSIVAQHPDGATMKHAIASQLT